MVGGLGSHHDFRDAVTRVGRAAGDSALAPTAEISVTTYDGCV